MSSNRRDGLLTEKDREWLSGDGGGPDQKYALRVAMAKFVDDLKFIYQQNLEDIPDPTTESLSELFVRIDSSDNESDDDSNDDESDDDPYNDIDREECAKYLIALAYEITNEPIDYGQIAEDIILHPRDESKSPQESDGNIGAPMIPSQPIDELLSFRRALRDGIKLGKSRVESDNQETIPNTVLIDTNTRLYKEPTKDRLKPGSSGIDPDVPGFDTDDLRDAKAKWIGAGHPDDDSASLSYSQAQETMISEIDANILFRLSQRRRISDRPIIPNKLPDR